MSLPPQYTNIFIEVKYNFTSYRACLDAKHAIQRLEQRQFSLSEWKVEWAGICALLKTSVHLMKAKDARSCLPEKIKHEFKKAYDDLQKYKDRFPIFWKFIDKERNNILKEYEFAAYTAILKPDGSIVEPAGLLSLVLDGSTKDLMIRTGEYKGRRALDVLVEAVNWLEEYILSTIKKSGYDPEERLSAANLLPMPTKGLEHSSPLVGN